MNASILTTTASLVARTAAPVRAVGRRRPGATRTGNEACTTPTQLPPRRPADRGVSEVVGFIMLFGVLVLGLTMIQLYGVPATNERLEFEHSQRALTDVAELNDRLMQVAVTGQSAAATIEAGMQYPSRLFLFNPSPVSGALRTTGAGQVVVENAVVPGTQPDDVRDYWSGVPRVFETTGLAYRASYNLYDNAPTRVIEHGLVYDRFPNGGVLARNQAPLVEGNRITIVTLASDLDTATAGSIIVETAPASVPGEAVTLTNASPSDPIRLTIPTGLSEAEMEEVLSHEYPGGNVADVVAGPPGAVTVVLQPGTYELSLANLVVGGQAATPPSAHYLVPVTTGPGTVQEGTRLPITLQVRDALNNPVSGVTVEANASLGAASFTPTAAESDEDGHVQFEYLAPGQVTGSTQVVDDLQFTLGDRSEFGATFDPRTIANASLAVYVQNTDGSGLSSNLGAGEGGITDWQDDNNQTFAVANGKWLNIDEVGAIELSNAEHVVRQYCPGASGNPHADCRFVNEFRLTFTLWSGPDAYGVDVHLLDTNRDGDYDDTYSGTDAEWNELRHVTVTDANTNDVVFLRPLTDAAVQELSGDGIDVLDFAATYDASGGGQQSPDVGGQNELDLLKLVDASWFTGTVHGRVDVEVTAP